MVFPSISKHFSMRLLKAEQILATFAMDMSAYTLKTLALFS
jgi:hypothetical protein